MKLWERTEVEWGIFRDERSLPKLDHISRKSKYTQCLHSICSCCPGCIPACRHLHPFTHSWAPGQSWGTHSSLPCLPQHSIKAVAASRSLAHTMSLVGDKSEDATDVLNVLTAFMQALHLVCGRLGTDRSTKEGLSPNPDCEGRASTLHRPWNPELSRETRWSNEEISIA